MTLNNTLCSKAWTDLNISFSKRELRHCCKSKHESFPTELDIDFFNNSPGIVERRQDLISGIANSQCDSCWQSYKQTGTAYREHNNQWTTVSDINPNLEFIEVMLDNLCDMSCVYCDEKSSHKIAQEKGLPNRLQVPNEAEYHVFLDWLATLDYEYVLSFLGGELTYSKNFYKFLDMLLTDDRFKQKNLYLSLITNGNTNTDQLDRFFQLYEKIPNNWTFFMFFSNEATGELSEIVRWGLDWERYKQNFNRYLSYDKIKTVGLCPTPSMFTVDALAEYFTWAFDTIRKYNKKVIVTGNWVDGDLMPSPMYASNKSVMQDVRSVLEKNKDLFTSNDWYDNCLTWTYQLEKIINTRPYTISELNNFLDRLALQKKSAKIYKLNDYLA